MWQFASFVVAAHGATLQVISQDPEPVIDVRRSNGCADIQFGFEGGSVVRTNGTDWLFTAEMFRAPVDANMRCAMWRRPIDKNGQFERHGTIVSSNQTFPLIMFEQQCNEAWCPWQGATENTLAMRLQYECDPTDLLASPWAPQPIFDHQEGTWHILFVSYGCDATQLVTAGVGNIWGARSEVKGFEGIGGPYHVYGIVMGPNATDVAHIWGDAGRTAKYVDQIVPFQLPNGTYAALVGSVATWLAVADNVNGPWTVHSDVPMPVAVFQKTAKSAYNENPVVRRLR